MTVEQAIIDNNPGIDPLSLRDLTYLRKRCELLGIPVDAQDGPGKLQIEIFEKTAESTLLDPTFVYAYPAEVSPLSRAERCGSVRHRPLRVLHRRPRDRQRLLGTE